MNFCFNVSQRRCIYILQLYSFFLLKILPRLCWSPTFAFGTCLLPHRPLTWFANSTAWATPRFFVRTVHSINPSYQLHQSDGPSRWVRRMDSPPTFRRKCSGPCRWYQVRLFLEKIGDLVKGWSTHTNWAHAKSFVGDQLVWSEAVVKFDDLNDLNLIVTNQKEYGYIDVVDRQSGLLENLLSSDFGHVEADHLQIGSVLEDRGLVSAESHAWELFLEFFYK